MQLMGMRFRFGAEFGTFGFEDAMPPKTAELKGITAMGITSFPIGPGKIKLGIGIIGSSVGSMFESSYGFKFGSLVLRRRRPTCLGSAGVCQGSCSNG